MAQTTTHTTGAALNGCVPTQKPTPAPCPAWCDAHYTIGDHDPTVVHEGGISDVNTTDGDFVLYPVLYSGPESDTTEIVMSIRAYYPDNEDRYGIYLGLSFSQTQRLINELLDIMNRMLPLEQQTHLGPPGFELIHHDDGFGDLNGL